MWPKAVERFGRVNDKTIPSGVLDRQTVSEIEGDENIKNSCYNFICKYLQDLKVLTEVYALQFVPY